MKKFVRFAAVILLVLACVGSTAFASAYQPIDFNEEQAAAANLFLSNFTEVGVRNISSFPSDQEMVDFAHDHMWFNDSDSFEYGEYSNGNNCRVSDDRIQEIVDKYFYYRPKRVDLSQTRFDYHDGYYYHCETGGWINDGFAHVISICPTGEENIYFVSFLIFGGGNYWENSVMNWSLEQIEAEYDYISGYGSAMIYAENLSDRSTYKIIFRMSYTWKRLRKLTRQFWLSVWAAPALTH